MRFHSKLFLIGSTVLLGSSLAFAQQGAPPAPNEEAAPAVVPDTLGGPGVELPAPPDGPAEVALGEGPQHARRFGRGGAMGERGFGGPQLMLARLVNNPTLRERLGITAEQAAKIRQQTSDFEKSQIRSHADLAVKRMELRDLLSAEKPDRAAIDRKLTEISAAQLVREKSTIDFHLTMRDALTPEQRQKLEQWREEQRQRVSGFGPGRDGRRGLRNARPGDKPDSAPSAPKPQGESQD